MLDKLAEIPVERAVIMPVSAAKTHQQKIMKMKVH